jgi:2,4-dienoyl-CoA reductase (NADPH2)
MASVPYPHLMSPATIGSVRLRNRIVQAPMGTGMMRDGRVTAGDIAFIEARARGGVGLIITGAGPVHETSIVAGRILTEAWDEAAREALHARVDAVHAHGARIFGQILHLGRESSGETQAGGATEYVPLAPSAVPSPRDPSPPHAMSISEIRMLIGAYARSAANYRAAGYDGVEIQACHAYLVSQFLAPASNVRTDEYGGATPVERMRFLVEVIEAVRAECGADHPLGVRVSAEDLEPGGLTFEDTLAVVEALQRSAPVDYVSVTTGARGAYVKDTTFAEGFARGFSAAIRQRVDVPVIVTGRFRTPALAERVLASGDADFIGLGRALLADPDWAAKAQAGEPSQIRPCIGIVQDCRRSIGLIACTIHALTGREHEWGDGPVPARQPGRVVVAGGGPAGLEAARVAAASGHEVILFERSEKLGGQLRVAAAAPTRAEILDFVHYCERELDRLGVELRMSTPATSADIVEQQPDLVVCATGAEPGPPAISVTGGAEVLNVWELLGEPGADREPNARRAVVIDDGAGFWHGVGAAEFLAERGISVELVTRARGIGLTIPHESAAGVLRRLRAHGVRFHTLTRAVSFDGAAVQIRDAITGEPLDSLAADLVVIRRELVVNDRLARELDGRTAPVALIGDCAAPRKLTHAVLEANRAIRRFNAGELSKSVAIVF